MTSPALRLLQPKSHHLHSLAAFATPFPEFMSTSTQKDNLIDEAFKASFVDQISDLKYWKEFRSRFLAKAPVMSPREAARLKYALSYQGSEAVMYAHWGREDLSKRLEEDCVKNVKHMNAEELLSSLYGFRSLKHESLYTSLLSALHTEIQSTSDLNLLSIAPYIVSHSSINSQYLPKHKPKPDTSSRNLAFLETIQPLISTRITEFNDNQIAALCAGIANSNIEVEKRIKVKELMDGLERDVVNRRMERMSGSNLVDVTKAFVRMNWGTEELFEGIGKYAQAKLSSMSADELADLGYHLSLRSTLPSSFQSSLESHLLPCLSSVRPDFSPRLALYLFHSSSSNLPLLQSFTSLTEQRPAISLRKHYPYRIFKTYLECKYPQLVTDTLSEKIHGKSPAFDLNRMLVTYPRAETSVFRLVGSLLGRLGFRMAAPYAYNNLGIIDFAKMPEKVGISLALPGYDLLGKYDTGTSLVKKEKRVFKISNECHMRSELLRMKGWKVLEWNSHDLVENLDSASAREQFVLSSLQSVDVKPLPPN